MALLKKIKQRDGVDTEYHRILFMQITTNRQITIAVESYVDEVARNSGETGEISHPYSKITTYETDYDENMNIKKAYQFLKKTDVFTNSLDI